MSPAFEHIYRLHSRRIYALCLRIVRNLTEAEDLTQEAFFKVFRKIKTFRGESTFSTWLHRLAVNVVLMHLREKKLPGAPLEEITRRDEENTGPKEVGGPDLTLTGLFDRVNLEHCGRAVALDPQDSVRAARRPGLQTPRDCRDDGFVRGDLKGTTS